MEVLNTCSVGVVWMMGRDYEKELLMIDTSHGRRSLVGYSPWGRKESDTTERLHFHFYFHALEKEMATRSSVLAWRIPGMAAWWAAVYGVAQSRTRLKRLSSHSSSIYMKCLEYRQCLLVLAIVRILLL